MNKIQNKINIGQKEKQIIKKFEESFPNLIHFDNKILGRGGFNIIHSVTLNNTISGAGKILKIAKNNPKKDEIYFSTVLKGQNLIRKHTGLEVDNGADKYHLIIMEKAQLSDLNKLIHYLKNRNLLKTIFFPFGVSENLLRYFTKQLVNGLSTIRKYGFAHMDLKPKNFLVADNLDIKISDYSIMKCLNDEKEKIEKPGGTNGYMAPEYYEYNFLDKNLLEKYDIYGLGASLYNIITGKTILDVDKFLTKMQKKSKIKQQYERNSKKINYLINEGLSEEFVDLLKRMVKYNPEDRIDFDCLVRNEWINRYSKEIGKIVEQYEYEEDKAIMEIFKSDVLFKYYRKTKKQERKKKFVVLMKKRKYVREIKNLR